MNLPSGLEDRDWRTIAKKTFLITIVVAVVVAVLIGVLVATGVLTQPTVTDTSRGWGDVTNDTTEIQTSVTVDNPNPVGIPGLLTIQYTASLNDVILVDEQREGVGLGTGENNISLTAEMPNGRIAEWWVTHVNNGEQSTLTIDPAVSGPGFSRDLAERTSQFETNLLNSFTNTEARTVTLNGESILKLTDQQAAWGEATEETTPLTITAPVENVHSHPVTLSGVEYTIEMNGVTLGNGTTNDGLEVAPGESGTLTVDANLDTAQFAAWWPTHVRKDESSTMDIQMYGLIERDGNTQRIPIALFERSLQFETDLLGDNGTATEQLATDSPAPALPSVGETDRRWGDVTSEGSELLTTIAIEGDDSEANADLRDILRLESDREIRINDVVVADEQTTIDNVPPAGESLTLASTLDNNRVPKWWSRHINNGEQSSLTAVTDTTVDVGLTKFDLDVSAPNRTFTTDMISSLNTDKAQSVTIDDNTVLSLTEQQAAWGEATVETTPLQITAPVENVHSYPVTLSGVEYTIEMNGVTLGNGTSDDSLDVAPGESGTLTVDAEMDTEQFETWWPTHLRNGETSTMDIRMYGVIERDGSTQRVPVTLIDRSIRFETDLLGENGTTTEQLATDSPAPSLPRLGETDRQWGDVTSEHSHLQTTVAMEGEDVDEDLRSILRLESDRELRINDVVVADEQTTVDDIPLTGESLTLTSELDNDRVPEWWARHLNNGEQSSLTAVTDTTVDMGLTRFDLDMPAPNSTFGTDMLGPLDTDAEQWVTIDDDDVLRVPETTAEWGAATPETAPLTVQGELVNEGRTSVTIEDVAYTVRINNLTLADDIDETTYRIDPGETEPLDLTMALDNTKMDRWWVRHLRNDETSSFDVEVVATISTGGQTYTVPLEAFSQNQTIETDILG